MEYDITIECVDHYRFRWFDNSGFGYVLANPRRLPFRPCKGQLGFFKTAFPRRPA